MVDVHIEHGEERVRIALDAVGFYSGANSGLAEDEVGEVVRMQKLSIGLEELVEETFERLVVDGGVWVEEVEIDINEALLG